MEEVIFAKSPFWVKASSANDLVTARFTIQIWQGAKDVIPESVFTRVLAKDVVGGNIVVDVSDIIDAQIPDAVHNANTGVWAKITVNVNDGEYEDSITRFALSGYTVAGTIQRYLSIEGGGVTVLSTLPTDEVVQSADTVYSLEGFSKIASRFTSDNASITKTPVVTLPWGYFDSTHKAFVEPKYRFSPLRLRFINRYGLLEEIWLAKRSTPGLTVKKNTFTRSNFNFDTLSYNTSQHVEQEYNTVGYRNWTASTGWMPEIFNTTIEDILLSDNKWLIEENGTVHAVNMMQKAQKFKTNLNETVIEYTWDFKESGPINNVIR